MATPIEVVLQQNVDTLGDGGDVVRVRPGYARNFLFPRGLALPLTKGNLARVEALKAAAAAAAQKETDDARAVASKIEATSVKLARAVGTENKMYGSVTSKDIEEAYAAIGIVLDRKQIHLPEPLKTLGLHEVPVKLVRGIDATLRVEVVKASSAAV
jgi:large subunit ribosomal protein L9